MVQVTIQNFAANATDIASIVDLGSLEIAGAPSITPTTIGATLTDGRSVSAVGTFAPVVTALATGNLDALLTGINQIRIDSLSVRINGTPWIDMSGLDLTGPEILGFIESSGISDAGDVTSEDINGAVEFVFAGDDTIVASIGNDTLNGFAGNDIVLGMDGNDLVFGSAGDDDVNGNLGNDTVGGGLGADFVRGGQHADIVNGGDGDDWHVNGNIGEDSVYGNLGNDTVFGGQGNDFIAGDNFAYEVGGNDLLIGNLGNDTLVGDPFNDTMQGGEGTDAFSIYTGDGDDVIVDFDPATEVIGLEPNINSIGYVSTSAFSVLQARISNDGQGNSVIDLGAGNSLKIMGVLPNQLEADNFYFLF